jgi:lipopolysaccharide export system protein LptA
MGNKLIFLLCLLGLAEKGGAIATTASPIFVKASGSVVCTQSEGVCRASPHVVVSREGSTLKTDALTLFLDKRKVGQIRKLKGFEAKGSVRMRAGNHRCIASRALYHAPLGRLCLWGNPVLYIKSVKISGESPLTLYTLAPQRALVKSPLVILQDKKIALRAQEATVFFTGSSSHQVHAQATSSKGLGIPQNDVSQIFMRKRCLVVTLEETLEAERATFDNKKKYIILEGAVKAVRQGSIVEAPKASINFNRGVVVRLYGEKNTQSPIKAFIHTPTKVGQEGVFHAGQ